MVELDLIKNKITKVIINGEIWTGEVNNPHASGVAISNDKIVAVGTSDEIKNLIKDNEDCQVIDAMGKFVIPGFIDSHIHFLMSGERLNSVKLKDCQTKQEFIDRIAKHAKNIEPGQWLTGGDWNHINWGDELPERFWIDEVTSKNPVWIGRHEGHTYLANTLAMKHAGLIDDDNKVLKIPQIEGGSVQLNNDGIPTGIFKDNALSLIFDAIPQPSLNEYSKFLDLATEHVLQYGVCSIHHMIEPENRNRGGTAGDLEIYEHFDKEGKLKIRVFCAVPIQKWQELKNRMEDINKNSKMLRCGAVKGYIDGSIGSHSALFHKEYIDTPGYAGDMVNNEENLFDWILNSDKNNIQVFIHAIGDKGISKTLDIFSKVNQINGEKDRRWRIEHSQHIDSNDIPRFKELGVIASVQPYHAIDDGKFLVKFLGKERLRGTFAFRSLLDAGAKLAFGSDWFVAPPNPILTIDAAVNRNIDGTCFIPEERITPEEALYACTLLAAYSASEDSIKGSIRNGKLADLVILDRNILKIDPSLIGQTNVLMTIIGGEIVYNKLTQRN